MHLRRKIAALAVALGTLVLGAPAVTTAPAHAAGTLTDGHHFSSYTWAGTRLADAREVWVFDRTDDDAASTALQQYLNAMDALWQSYPGLPYFLYQNDRGNANACFEDGSSGHMPGYNLILACSNLPVSSGTEGGLAAWSRQLQPATNHVVGEADAIIRHGLGFSVSYTGWCHEIGHIIGLTNHDTDPSGCMYAYFGSGNGYNQDEVNQLLNLYYSHSIYGD